MEETFGKKKQDIEGPEREIGRTRDDITEGNYSTCYLIFHLSTWVSNPADGFKKRQHKNGLSCEQCRNM